MSLHDEKAAALAEVLAATGEPVVWKGQTYQALVSDNPLSHDLGLGGFDSQGDCTIKIPRSALGAERPSLASESSSRASIIASRVSRTIRSFRWSFSSLNRRTDDARSRPR
jgi:hypothetical protein